MSSSTDFPSKYETLRDIVIRQVELEENNKGGSTAEIREHTIVFIGSRQVGKTSLIHQFLDRDDIAKPTLALDYTYGRKSGRSLYKDVCHIWELGGGTAYLPLLQSPFASLDFGAMGQLTVVLMLDLSDPHHLWFTMETLLHELFKCIQRQYGSSNLQSLQNDMWARLGGLNPDSDFMDPFPVPLIILGGKYDVFKDFDPQNKKVICRCLRYVALTLGATLQFYSIKEPGLIKKAKDLLFCHGFGSSAIKSISTDFNKPLLIPAGSDSMEQIGAAGTPIRNKDFSLKGPGNALKQWKHLLASHYKQEGLVGSAMPEDPTADLIAELEYCEPIIEQLRMQKYQELQKHRQEAEKREKSEDDFFKT